VRSDNPDLTQKYIIDSELRKKSMGVIDFEIRGGEVAGYSLLVVCTYFKGVFLCVFLRVFLCVFLCVFLFVFSFSEERVVC